METSTVIVTAVLTSLTTLLGIHFKSYFTRKGQNAADKEDLEKLTGIVESVKAGLSLVTQKQRSVFDEEKAAIVEFFARWNSWVWNTLHFDIYEYNYGHVEELSGKIVKYREAYRETQVAYSKVQLLIWSSDLQEKGHEMMLEALKYQHTIDPILTALKHNLNAEKSVVDRLAKDLSTRTGPITDSDQLGEWVHQKAEELSTERSRLLEQYHEKTSEMEPALKRKSEFTALARLYLNTH